MSNKLNQIKSQEVQTMIIYTYANRCRDCQVPEKDCPIHIWKCNNEKEDVPTIEDCITAGGITQPT